MTDTVRITSTDVRPASPFYRALAAKQHADDRRDWLADAIAGMVADGITPTDHDLDEYRRRRAAATYAAAVYAEHADPILAALDAREQVPA